MRDERILANLIARQAAEHPDLDVLTFVDVKADGGFAEEVRTFRELWDNGQRVAQALRDAGMQAGDRFALLMQNHPEFVDAMVGSSIAATVFVPIDPRTRGEKLAFMLAILRLPRRDLRRLRARPRARRARRAAGAALDMGRPARRPPAIARRGA